MFADGSQWDVIAKILSKDYRVIVCGSTWTWIVRRGQRELHIQIKSMLAHCSTLESLAQLKLSQLSAILWGGVVVLAYSSSYPESVEQLYLISTIYFRARANDSKQICRVYFIYEGQYRYFYLIEKDNLPRKFG